MARYLPSAPSARIRDPPVFDWSFCSPDWYKILRAPNLRRRFELLVPYFIDLCVLFTLLPLVAFASSVGSGFGDLGGNSFFVQGIGFEFSSLRTIHLSLPLYALGHLIVCHPLYFLGHGMCIPSDECRKDETHRIVLEVEELSADDG